MIYHDDCLVRMPKLKAGSVDLILTDPPYGTTACKWDSVIPLELMWIELKRLIKPNGAIVMTASQPFTSALVMSNSKMFRYCWVWCKGRSTNFMSAKLMPLLKTEDVCVFSLSTCNSMSKLKMKYYPQNISVIDRKVINGKNVGGRVAEARRAIFTPGKIYTQKVTGYPTNMLNIKNNNNKSHPTQKPVALMEYMIKTYTLEGETVLDFTMGSGTTGVACKRLKRKFVGIEKDQKYFEIAKERIKKG